MITSIVHDQANAGFPVMACICSIVPIERLKPPRQLYNHSSYLPEATPAPRRTPRTGTTYLPTVIQYSTEPKTGHPACHSYQCSVPTLRYYKYAALGHRASINIICLPGSFLCPWPRRSSYLFSSPHQLSLHLLVLVLQVYSSTRVRVYSLLARYLPTYLPTQNWNSPRYHQGSHRSLYCPRLPCPRHSPGISSQDMHSL